MTDNFKIIQVSLIKLGEHIVYTQDFNKNMNMVTSFCSHGNGP